MAAAGFARWRRWPITTTLFLLALAWALFTYRQGVEGRLGPGDAGRLVTVTGTVASVPEALGDRLRFRFQPDPGDAAVDLPDRILVSWYRDWPVLRVGQRWQLTLRLKPPWATINFSGPDRERWLFAERIGALGSVRSGERIADPAWSDAPAQGLRESVRDAIGRVLGSPRNRAVVLALATADRSGLDRHDRAVLRATGTAHLLAISGLHVGLAALGAGLLVRCLVPLLPLTGTGRFPHLLVLAGGLAGAAGYAVLADMGVSTQRAFLMVAAVTGAIVLARPVHPVRALILALVAVLVADPLAPLASGFWFSFAAVFALLFAFQSRPGRLPWWKTLVAAQSVVFVFLLPVGAAWLGGFSPIGFIANLLAVPWVSLLVVPPVLAGIVALPLFEPAAAWLWILAGHASGILFQVLDALAAVQHRLTGLNVPDLPALALASVGALLLLLPRAAGMRLPGAFLLLPLFLPGRTGPGEGELQIEALDVGQGTAIVLKTQNHALLYDSGPGDNAGADFVDSAIAPLFNPPGSLAPERLVLSHGDLDHAGGLYSLLRHFPGIAVIGSTGADHPTIERCLSGMRWHRDGFDFLALHPSPGLPYLRNNSSCVLSVRRGDSGVLLSGDVDSGIENRLVLDGLARHDVVLVPHHGSAGSSSPAFVEQVDARIALATAGLGNRFGFPREVVRQRYRSRGSTFLATGECGGLRIVLHADGSLSGTSARRERQRIWRWPAAADCP